MADKFTFSTYTEDKATGTEIVFTSANDYNDPGSDTETRRQLSTPLYQIRKFINTVLFDNAATPKIRAGNLPVATTSANGAMSSSDKTKLDGATSEPTASKIAMYDANKKLYSGGTGSTDEVATKGYVSSAVSNVTLESLLESAKGSLSASDEGKVIIVRLDGNGDPYFELDHVYYPNDTPLGGNS